MVVNVVFIALALAGFVFMFLRARPDTTGQVARGLVAKGARLIDVRTPDEFAGNKLDGSINIPTHELTSRLSELRPRDRTIVLYCASGMRSANAARSLRRAGFTAIHNMGAMARW